MSIFDTEYEQGWDDAMTFVDKTIDELLGKIADIAAADPTRFSDAETAATVINAVAMRIEEAAKKETRS